MDCTFVTTTSVSAVLALSDTRTKFWHGTYCVSILCLKCEQSGLVKSMYEMSLRCEKKTMRRKKEGGMRKEDDALICKSCTNPCLNWVFTVNICCEKLYTFLLVNHVMSSYLCSEIG